MRLRGAVLLAMSVMVANSSGQEKEANPFEDPEFLKASLGPKSPENWEFVWEVFSLPFSEAAELRRQVKNHRAIYAELVERAEKKKAVLEVFEVNKVLERKGSSTLSIVEFIYPTEHEPPELPNIVGKVPNNVEVARLVQTPSMPSAFDTKELGLTLKLDKITDREEGVDLQFSMSEVSLEGLDTWGQKKATMKVPRFEVQRVRKNTVLHSGQVTLFGTFSPPGGKARRVWLAFVTATLQKR